MKFILMQSDLRPTKAQYERTVRYFCGTVPIDVLRNAQILIGGPRPNGPETRGSIPTSARGSSIKTQCPRTQAVMQSTEQPGTGQGSKKTHYFEGMDWRHVKSACFRAFRTDLDLFEIFHAACEHVA